MSSLTLRRWLIERDYEELKQGVGLGDFEGRGWRGFHHHATLSIAVYGFLISEREAFPPSRPLAEMLIQKFAIPTGYRPLGIVWKCNRYIKSLVRRGSLSTEEYRKYSSPRNLTTPRLRRCGLSVTSRTPLRLCAGA